MSFVIGDKVIYVPSQEKGIVVKVHPPARGRVFPPKVKNN